MPQIVSLAEKYRDYFKIGAAVNPASVEKYGDLIARHFNSLTCENEMKPASLRPAPGEYNFERADVVANFARAHGIAMRGHTFVWHAQAARWFFDNTPEQVLALLADHMKTVSERYRDVIYAWDVVNEAINDHPEGGALRERTPWLEKLGSDYLHTAFRMARDILPAGTALVYNDYNESYPLKRARIIETVKNINRDGQLVDVIGMQSHWHIEDPTLDEIRRSIELYADLGCKVQLTELDLSIHDQNEAPGTVWDTPERIEQHAKFYGDAFAILREYKDVITSVTLWGVTDGTSWLNNFPVPGRRDYAMLFTDDGQPKEAFYRITDF